MRLNVWAFARAVGLVAAVVFTICAFIVAIAPETTAAFIGYLLHINLDNLTRPISWPSYLAGLVGVSLVTALSASAVVWFYNRLA